MVLNYGRMAYFNFTATTSQMLITGWTLAELKPFKSSPCYDPHFLFPWSLSAACLTLKKGSSCLLKQSQRYITAVERSSNCFCFFKFNSYLAKLLKVMHPPVSDCVFSLACFV